MVKHFFKLLTIFIIMILIGLAGVFLVSYFDKDGGSMNVLDNQNNTVK